MDVRPVGGYVAADISALVAEASHFILSEKLAHRQSALSGVSTGFNGPSSAAAISSASTDTSVVRTADLGLRILTDSLTAAMTVIAPSCLRGLAVQLPNVSPSDDDE
jgi:hypothetical protein